jgi:hypothetical protein
VNDGNSPGKQIVRLARACGPRIKRLADMILLYYGSYRFENVHPLKCGILRRLTLARSDPQHPRA